MTRDIGEKAVGIDIILKMIRNIPKINLNDFTDFPIIINSLIIICIIHMS